MKIIYTLVFFISGLTTYAEDSNLASLTCSAKLNVTSVCGDGRITLNVFEDNQVKITTGDVPCWDSTSQFEGTIVELKNVYHPYHPEKIFEFNFPSKVQDLPAVGKILFFKENAHNAKPFVVLNIERPNRLFIMKNYELSCEYSFSVYE